MWGKNSKTNNLTHRPSHTLICEKVTGLMKKLEGQKRTCWWKKLSSSRKDCFSHHVPLPCWKSPPLFSERPNLLNFTMGSTTSPQTPAQTQPLLSAWLLPTSVQTGRTEPGVRGAAGKGTAHGSEIRKAIP